MKSYLDYKFLGVHSFIESLETAGVDHRIFDEDYGEVYEQLPDHVNSGDSIKTGIAMRDGEAVFFTEFGIKLTKSYSSYIVFIFDHHPVLKEVLSLAEELESIVSANLDNVDLSMFAQKVSQ